MNQEGPGAIPVGLRRERRAFACPHAILAEAVEVQANFNPGAIVRVATVADDGSETEVWSGPAQREGAPRITRLPFTRPVSVKRLKLTLDTGAVAGWNEIDAVTLVAVPGELHWATQATASSSWQSSPVAP